MNDELDIFGIENEDFEEYQNERELNIQESEPEYNSVELAEEYDLTSEILKIRGIDDPTKINFEDESGAIITRSWDELSKNEQLSIIINGGADPDVDIDNSEIELINAIRNSNLSPQDYINSLIQEALNQNQPEQIYKIDDLNDDELVAMDLLTKVGRENITDEEIQQYIENAKQNEQLYWKTAEKLRDYYRTLEDNNRQQEEQDKIVKAQESYTNFSNTILNLIDGFDNFAGQPIELNRNDKENLAKFILEIDATGMSEFSKLMNDPSEFTQAAFWMLNKDNILAEFERLKQEAYKRGFNMGKGNIGKSSIYIKTKTDTSKNAKSNATIDGFSLLDDENYLD